MNRVEKEEYVIRLYKEGRSVREIAEVMHMSFRDIAIIKKAKLEADGERGSLQEDDDIKSKSKTTQAIKMLSELKTPIEVAIALDLPVNQIEAIYREYWKLDGMFKLTQIYEEAKYDLHDLLDLHRMVKGLGIEKQDLINVLDFVKYNQLRTMQWQAGCLRSEINALEWERRSSTNQIFELKWTIHEHEESLAQKRGEMAYLNRECRKLRQRFTDYNAKLPPITESKPDTDSDSTQIVPYSKERLLACAKPYQTSCHENQNT
jgi:hypothetical protein